jgi:hypothetical protein
MKPVDNYPANFLRALVYWMNTRPDYENDGKTVEQIIEEFREHQKTS